MIDLNDFIPSMDFLTAVSEGLMERQRNVTISCCSSSANHTTARNIRHGICSETNIYIRELK